ncbi:hypothetical protein SGLAM104S_08970 [Streptomyces glaucescens]
MLKTLTATGDDRLSATTDDGRPARLHGLRRGRLDPGNRPEGRRLSGFNQLAAPRLAASDSIRSSPAAAIVLSTKPVSMTTCCPMCAEPDGLAWETTYWWSCPATVP